MGSKSEERTQLHLSSKPVPKPPALAAKNPWGMSHTLDAVRYSGRKEFSQSHKVPAISTLQWVGTES